MLILVETGAFWGSNGNMSDKEGYSKYLDGAGNLGFSLCGGLKLVAGSPNSLLVM